MTPLEAFHTDDSSSLRGRAFWLTRIRDLRQDVIEAIRARRSSCSSPHRREFRRPTRGPLDGGTARGRSVSKPVRSSEHHRALSCSVPCGILAGLKASCHSMIRASFRAQPRTRHKARCDLRTALMVFLSRRGSRLDQTVDSLNTLRGGEARPPQSLVDEGPATRVPSCATAVDEGAR